MAQPPEPILDPSPEAPAGDPVSRSGVLAAALLCTVLALLGALGVSTERSWGWDESMHAELPAARIVLALGAGEWGEAGDVVLGCSQYPFVWPLILAGVQLVTGISEDAARAVGRLLWGAGCFGLFLLGRELARALAGRCRPGSLAVLPWLLLSLGALCPLALAYAGTLFQEVPFTVAAIFALLAWVRRDGRPGRELVAGGWIAVAFFTRFNAGLCLGLGLFLDLAVEAVQQVRAGELRAFARRTATLVLVPGLALAWWFLLPLPGGGDVAAEHREAFWNFLQGNRGAGFAIPWGQRLAHWTCSFAPTPRLFLLELVGIAAALPLLGVPRVRGMFLVLVGGGLPVWTHDFHLDRFLLPGGPALWALAAVGLVRLLPAARPGLVAGVGLALAIALPSLDARPVALALIQPGEEAEEYVAGVVADWGRLDPGRPLETNGLRRSQADRVLDLVSAAAGPGERVGWLGINTELSPAALHLGLLARGGSPERFRREAARTRPEDGQPALCVSFEGVDPGWTPAKIRTWAAGFDVLFTTRPVDFKGRAVRDWVLGYQAVLLDDGAWFAQPLGTFEVARPVGAPVPVELFACRRTP